MSLRAFHLLFVAVSVILAVFVAAWAVGQYQLEHEVRYAVTCVVAIACSGLLVVYGAMFQRKTRNL
jgi:Ca2+/Na+ antiporter